MSNAEKHKNTPTHRKLPSFTELIESFPKNKSISEDVPNASRPPLNTRISMPSVSHSPKSSLESISSQSGLDRLQHNRRQESDLSPEQPKNYRFSSYSYDKPPSHIHDDSFPDQFKFPANSQSTSRLDTFQRNQSIDLKGSQIHKRSISLPWEGTKAAQNNKRDFLIRMFNTLNNIGDINNKSESIKTEFLKLLEQNHGNDISLHENMIDVSFSTFPNITQLSESSVDQFISKISNEQLEGLARTVAETSNLISSLSGVIRQSRGFQNQPTFIGPMSSYNPLDPSIQGSSQRPALKKISSSSKIEKRKHKRQLSSASGSTINLKVKTPSLDESDVVMKGGLNTELSSRPNLVCTHCLSKNTPEWRRGPDGSRTLCNACGLFYSKLIRRFGLFDADKIMKERKFAGHTTDRRIN